jgi:hypothetical protein
MSADEVRAIVTQVLGNGVPLQEHVYLIIVFASLLASGIGAWLGSYLREKGKNYATREDLDKIIEQLRQTTRATEEIKAQISGDLWVRQRRRELQLEVLHDVNEFLSKIQALVIVDPDRIRGKEAIPLLERAYGIKAMVLALFTAETFRVFEEAVEFINRAKESKEYEELHDRSLNVIQALVEEVCRS